MKKSLFFIRISIIVLSVMMSSHVFAAATQYKVPGDFRFLRCMGRTFQDVDPDAQSSVCLVER